MRRYGRWRTALRCPMKHIRPLVLAAAVPLTAGCAVGVVVNGAKQPLVIAEQGDFYVGGRVVASPATSSSGEGDPNPGNVVINQMYVQYQIPAKREYKLPVIMVHGSWHTGKTYGSTPDGREGWGTYFVRKGFATYIVDDVNRGRSSYDMTPMNEVRLGMAPKEKLPPISQRSNESAWKTFRIGPSVGVPHPNTQFPKEAAEQYFAQLTDQYRYPDENTKRVAALVALLDKIGPVILMVHSSSGPVGWEATLARLQLVKGVVSVEPILLNTFKDFKALTPVPVTVIRGDFDPPQVISQAKEFIAGLHSAGGSGTFMHLPGMGITGNSHMLMMERNNLQIADLIINWIDRNVAGVKAGGAGR